MLFWFLVFVGATTFKYTRLETSAILADITAGYSVDDILKDFDLSDLQREAIDLANQAFYKLLKTSCQWLHKRNPH